ncbi:MAG: cysteine peptidase family C39 domain-containing protein, partial [Phycisphaerales bacterium]
DSVRPDADLAGNSMTKEFNMDWNRRRIFAWDGESYTIYTSGNNAYVDMTGSIHHVVNGPLTAGVIPWGYGNYTYRNLAAAECSGNEENFNGRTQVRLTLNLAGSEIELVLNPDQDYSIISYEIKNSKTIEFAQCDEYQLVSGNWVPRNIYTEQRDASTNRQLGYDSWNLTRINGQTPSSWSFNVDYENDTLIEYHSYVSEKPAMYRYFHTVDTDMLLAERLSFAAAEGIQPQNCATAALKYAAQQLGKNVTDRQLAQLISGQDNSTSLYAMKQFAQRLGLYCRAVKLDIKALKNIDDCQAILHIPGKSHFVVLGGTDSKYVFCIDLANDKFLYRTKLDFFGMDWSEGTALLISDKPIANQYNNINDDKLQAITGGSGYYSCTKLLQESDYVQCSYVGGYCGGYVEIYWKRHGCEPAESGSCSTSYILRAAETPCILNYYGTGCTVTGEWTTFYMQACD